MLTALRTTDGKRLALLWLTLALFAQWFAAPAHALSQQSIDKAAIGADPIAAAVLSLCLPSQLDEEGSEPRAISGLECQVCNANSAYTSSDGTNIGTAPPLAFLLNSIQQDELAVTLYFQHNAARAPPVSN